MPQTTFTTAHASTLKGAGWTDAQIDALKKVVAGCPAVTAGTFDWTTFITDALKKVVAGCPGAGTFDWTTFITDALALVASPSIAGVLKLLADLGL